MIDTHAELVTNASSDTRRANLIMHLQRSYGNRYVQGLLQSKVVQAKPTLSRPNDEYEQETDRVTEEGPASIQTLVSRQEEEEKKAEPVGQPPVAAEYPPEVVEQANNYIAHLPFNPESPEANQYMEVHPPPVNPEVIIEVAGQVGPVGQPPVAAEYPPEVVQQALNYIAQMPFNPESPEAAQYMEVHPPPVSPEVIIEVAGQVGPVE